jgi:TetR/AcrR family transcriptional regulator, mexJK operon transcriptional repressor
MGKKARKRSLGPGRLSAEETARLPERLLDAALDLFEQRGYAETSMEQIARHAGASTKTLYSRYANKAEILTAAIGRLVERALVVHAAELSDDPRKADPRSVMVSLGRRIATGLSHGQGSRIAYLLLTEARRIPDLAAIYKAGLAHGTGLFGRALEGWHAEGLLPEVRDIQRTSRLCLSVMTDIPRIRAAIGDPMTAAEIEGHIAFAAEFFLRGCGYRSGAR